MSLFASLSRVESNTSLISLRSLATCLQAIDPSCTYRTVRARLKSPVYTKALTVCGNDCGFSIDMLATIVTVCLAKLDEDAKRDALAEALNLSRPNTEVTDKADAKVVTAIANNHTAIVRAKTALDNTAAADTAADTAVEVAPVYLEDGHEDSSDDELAVNDATNWMTVALKTAAAYGDDVTDAVEFKPYNFNSKLGFAAGAISGFLFTPQYSLFDLKELLKTFGEVMGCNILLEGRVTNDVRILSDATGASVVPATSLLRLMNNVFAPLFNEGFLDEVEEALVLDLYKDAITLVWQCTYSDDVERLTLSQAISLAAQIQGRFDDLTKGQRDLYNVAAGKFIERVVSRERVIPCDCVECISQLNAAQTRINDRRAKEAAASAAKEAVTSDATVTTTTAAASTKATPKAVAKTTVEASVLNGKRDDTQGGGNAPSCPMGCVYDPVKGACEFYRVDVYGEPVAPGLNSNSDTRAARCS